MKGLYSKMPKNTKSSIVKGTSSWEAFENEINEKEDSFKKDVVKLNETTRNELQIEVDRNI